MMEPLGERPLTQPSSRFTYTYPASRRPLETIASAISVRLTASQTNRVQLAPPKWFQVENPIGGCTMPLSRAGPRPRSNSSAASGMLPGPCQLASASVAAPVLLSTPRGLTARRLLSDGIEPWPW